MDIIESLLCVLALSTDAFATSFAYGSDRIKISAMSLCIISGVCGFTFMISLLCGEFVQLFLSPNQAIWVSSLVLMTLGAGKFLNSIIKQRIKRQKVREKKLSFSFFHINVILQIYADPKEADLDSSKILTPLEAFPLSIALSLDGLAAGFGMAFGSHSIWLMVLFSILFNFMALFLGDILGKKAAERMKFDMSWAGGVILMVVAILKWI